MVVLITGCRSGFGLLTAVSAAQAGHTVYAGLRDLTTADDLIERSQGLDVIPVQLDVTDPEQREAVVARIEAEHGALGGLINNAGIALGGPLEEVSEAELRHLIEVNVMAPFLLTQRALPKMRERESGVVLMVSSMAGRIAMPGVGAYSTTKFALSGMTEAWRSELRPFGIRVVLVEPGPYKTDIFGRNRRIAGGTLSRHSPYYEAFARLEGKARRWADLGGDAQDVADRMVELLLDPAPPWRVPMGPTVLARRVLRTALPDWAWEALIRRVIA